MVCSGLVGRYSGQLSGLVLAAPGGVWEPCEPAVQSRAALGGVRAFSAFLFPPFLWRSKEKGVGCRGEAPAGCNEGLQTHPARIANAGATPDARCAGASTAS